jgi:hypothetical protein
MALNRERVGVSYPSYVYEVSREKIREYAMALGESHPRYHSAGDDCIAPPTFAAAFTVIKGAAAAFSDPELGTHPVLVHGSQRFEFGSRPVRPGDVLVCTPRIADIAAKGRNEFLTIEVDCRFRDDDERAVLAASTIVLLGSAPEEDGAPAGGAA